MKVLEMTGITRSYEHGTPVLRDVDLSVEEGEVVGLLGENGAGKTTLLKIALGTLHAQKGEVRVFGLDPVEHPIEVKQRIGYVSEDQSFPPYLKVSEVLAMHRSLFPTWDQQVAERLCMRFALSGKERIERLSKGQARQVAVLCAIAHRPELLLLDEPAGGFDPAARREFLETALQLLSDEGSSILFSSHHMQDVERIAGRVAFLHERTMLLNRDLDDLREQTSLAIVPAQQGVELKDFLSTTGCLGSRVTEGELRGVFEGTPAEVRSRLEPVTNGSPAHVAAVTLEDLFVEIVGGRR